MELCANLRWKAFYGKRWATEAALRADLARNDCPYSCLRTCQPFGPDGQLAAPEVCGRGRPCFEPSPLTPRRTS